jgi:CubicO group peptidase (beta-lactamase class C family)
VLARVTYSDLNFIVLRFLLEDLYGARRFDEIVKTEIFEPFKSQKYIFQSAEGIAKTNRRF